MQQKILNFECNLEREHLIKLLYYLVFCRQWHLAEVPFHALLGVTFVEVIHLRKGNIKLLNSIHPIYVSYLSQFCLQQFRMLAEQLRQRTRAALSLP